jgi:hypothetical protein
MAEYDKTNTFTLNKNDKGDNPKRPDYRGKLNVDGIEFTLSGWVKEGPNAHHIKITPLIPGEPVEEYKGLSKYDSKKLTEAHGGL